MDTSVPLSQVNATACAVPRLLIALLESNQQEVRAGRIAVGWGAEVEAWGSGRDLRPALSPGWLGPRAPRPPALPWHRSDHGPHPRASPVHWPQPAPEAQAPGPACFKLRTPLHQSAGLWLLPGAQGTLEAWDLFS